MLFDALRFFHIFIEIRGTNFRSEFSVFSVMAGWIAEMLFMLLFVYTAL